MSLVFSGTPFIPTAASAILRGLVVLAIGVLGSGTAVAEDSPG
jgi:hypothetical protein